MYPSSNSDNPFEFLLKRSLFHCDHQSPSSNQIYNNDPHFFSNFPSPFFDEHELPLNHILSQSQPMSGTGNHNNSISTDSTKDETPEKSSVMAPNLIEKPTDHHKPLKRRNLGAIPRKRTGKKDRHSKIRTAQGIRDRRMRLSLQVARKFFDLQDMLGYDKASKTIEWLFTNSKTAIKELINNEGKSESFISECEGVSGIEETSNVNLRKTPNRTELRDKARARARCRTKEKMMSKGIREISNTKRNNDFPKIGSSSNNPFESIVDQESSSINQEGVDIYPSFDRSTSHQFDDVGTIEKLLQGSLSSSTSCPILGSWDLMDINQVSLGGNPSSNFSAGTDFPLFHQ